MAKPPPAGTPTATVLDKAMELAGKQARPAGSGWTIQCPAHDDRTASLSVGEGRDGAAVLKCHAGCTTDSVLHALGMDMAELFPPDPEREARRDVVPSSSPGTLVEEYPYCDEDGVLLYTVQRFDPKTFRPILPDGSRSLRNVRRVLYKLPKVREQAEQGKVVLVVEGEKDVHTAEALGFVATTSPSGSSSWQDAFAPSLTNAFVVVVPDNDEPGRAYADTVAASVRQYAKRVRVVELPGLADKGDLTDWVNDGGTREGLEQAIRKAPDWQPPEAALRSRTAWTAQELLDVQWPQPKWAIPGVLPYGTTILAGGSKVGKSWLALSWATEIAQGGYALGRIPVEQGDVLYLALEDDPPRLTRRLTALVRAAKFDGADRLHLHTDWPSLDEGGADEIDQWLKRHPAARLVVIDVFAKVRPKGKGSKGASVYEADYEAMGLLKRVTDKHGVALVMLHHTRKAKEGDELDKVSGSTGVVGAADSILLLSRERGEAQGTLFITGRDVNEGSHALDWDEDTSSWRLADRDPNELTSRATRDVALWVIRQDRPVTVEQVAAGTFRSPAKAKELLTDAVAAGALAVTREGHYYDPTLTMHEDGPDAELPL